MVISKGDKKSRILITDRHFPTEGRLLASEGELDSFEFPINE